MPIRILIIAAISAALLVPAALAFAGPPAEQPLGAQLAALRQATVQYQDVHVAIADGYAPAGGCVEHMGHHFVRGNPMAVTPGDLDALDPNILVYAEQPNGRFRLVAVEWGVAGDAELYGQGFDTPGGGPPFHTLHAWIWQANPHGTFAAHNPNIRC
jgi:hypothetical protein